MCGIVMVSGRITAREERLFKQLLVLDTLRGEDSTGIASVNIEKEVRVSKAVGDPYQLFEQARTEEIFKQNNRVLIGHNRYATTGKVSRRNAHPFELDTLVGVHNGTLKAKYNLKNGNKFDVDSEALYHDIEDIGIEKAMEKAEGAWTLVWWDKEENVLNMLRNKERPFNYILSEDGKTIFGASESWMLTAILNREGYKTQAVHQLPEDMLYSWKIPLVSLSNYPEIDKPRVKHLTGKKEVVVVHQSPKALNVVPIGTGGTPSYLLAKEVVFTAMFIKKDKHGNEYLDLLDENHTDFDVRLYFNNSQFLRNAVGKKIMANIASSSYENNLLYYKVSPWSAEVINSVVIPKDTNGNEIDKALFEQNYHTCAWCSSSISYGEDCHIFDNHSGILCKSCVEDAEVNKYVKVC